MDSEDKEDDEEDRVDNKDDQDDNDDEDNSQACATRRKSRKSKAKPTGSNDKGQKAAEKPSGSAGLSAAGPAAEVAAGGFPVYTADSTVHDAILDSTPGLTDQYGMVHCSVCRAYTDQ